MSKRVKLHHKFDKERYTNLLKQGLGKRKIAELARLTGLNSSYLSKALHGKSEASPLPSTLYKISQYTITNGVTYEELLDACGYNPETYAVISDDTIEKQNNLPISSRPIDEIEQSSEVKEMLTILTHHPCTSLESFLLLYLTNYGQNFNALRLLKLIDLIKKVFILPKVEALIEESVSYNTDDDDL